MEIRIVIELDPVAQRVAVARRRSSQADAAVVPGAAIRDQRDVQELVISPAAVSQAPQVGSPHDQPIERAKLIGRRVFDLVEERPLRGVRRHADGLLTGALRVDPERDDLAIRARRDVGSVDAVAFHPVVSFAIIDHGRGPSRVLRAIDLPGESDGLEWPVVGDDGQDPYALLVCRNDRVVTYADNDRRGVGQGGRVKASGRPLLFARPPGWPVAVFQSGVDELKGGPLPIG